MKLFLDAVYVKLFLVSCLVSIKVTSTQEGTSYFFYQQPEYPRDCKEARNQCSSDNFSGIYTIKPDGYPKPFEVYCNNQIESGGWTVIKRRIDGSLTFKRNWEDYKTGFGFLLSEFYIGNDKLSYLTNQAIYELRIDMVLSNGSSLYVNYKYFRVSDEWSHYELISTKEFSGNSSCVVSTCQSNMNHGGCTCERLCRDLIGMTDCNDNCVETCIPEGCFINESLVLSGESFINADCTENCTCIDNQLSCNPDYQCSPDATCRLENGLLGCYCTEDYEGDGETCIRNLPVFTDCYDAYQAGYTADGVYSILPSGWTESPFDVFCDMTTTGGGWTVFQRRTDGKTDFYRSWHEYKEGFGSVAAGNDFWLGNEKLHYLTNQRDYTLRPEIVQSGSVSTLYDEYSSFTVGDESSKYQLNYATYTDVTAPGNGFYYNNGKQFSTHDQDNDGCSGHDFAERHRGGWWYHDYWCTYCYSSYCYYFEYGNSGCHTLGSYSNLNGDYDGGNGENIFWGDGGYNCNLNSTEMKIRPSSM